MILKQEEKSPAKIYLIFVYLPISISFLLLYSTHKIFRRTQGVRIFNVKRIFAENLNMGLHIKYQKKSTKDLTFGQTMLIDVKFPSDVTSNGMVRPKVLTYVHFLETF